MKKVIFFVLTLIIAFTVLMGCSTVKDFYFDNKELIRDIIVLILDTVFENIKSETVLYPSGDNSGNKVQAAIPCSPDSLTKSEYISRVEKILYSEKMWKTIDDRVSKLLTEKGVQ